MPILKPRSDSPFFLDQYLSDEIITAELRSNTETNNNKRVNTKGSAAIAYGVLESMDSPITITHNWGGNFDLMSSLVTGATKGMQSAVSTADTMISKGANLLNDSTGVDIRREQGRNSILEGQRRFTNAAIESNDGIYKAFAGTEMNIPMRMKIPFFKGLDSSGVKAQVKDLMRDYFMGSTTQSEFYRIINAPMDYKRPLTYDTKSIQGTFILVTHRFILDSLVPESIEISFSPQVHPVDNDPLYGEVNINFGFARKPTKEDLLDILTSK